MLNAGFTLHHWVSLAAGVVQVCAVALVLRSRSSSTSRFPLAALLLAIAIWNFSDVGADVASSAQLRSFFDIVDASASTITAALSLHFVAAFCGSVRALRWALYAAYGYAAATIIGMASGTIGWRAWSHLLIAGAGFAVLVGGWSLVRHHRVHRDPRERARTLVVLAALMIGGGLGVSDLFAVSGAAVPRVANIATLIAALLLIFATVRLALLDEEVQFALSSTLSIAAGAATIGFLGYRLGGPASLATILAFIPLAVALAAVLYGLFIGTRKRREARNELRTLGRLGAQMAHDLNNPLAAIRSSADYLLQEHREGRLTNDQATFAQLALDQSVRMTEVIARYQGLGAGAVKATSCDLKVLVEDVISPFRGSALKFATDVEDGLQVIQADRTLVASALDNVVRNATEAIRGQGTIRVVVAKNGRGVEVRVEDDGEGMSPRTVAEATRDGFTTKTDGRGLGLAFVQRIVAVHDGRLDIRSEPGAGTSVALWFPQS